MAKSFKTPKFAIRDTKGEYLWGMTQRGGVGFEDEDMPQFWALNERTKLFDSEGAAHEYAKKHELWVWTKYTVVPMTLTLKEA